MADILRLPSDTDLLNAMGRVALSQGKLDYVLRLCVKTISGLKLSESRNGTKRLSSKELRARVKKIAGQKIDDGVALTKIDALLLQAEKSTEKRNRLIHDISYYDRDGRLLIKEDNEPARPYPTAAEINAMANDLLKIANELNSARLKGFIAEALGTK